MKVDAQRTGAPAVVGFETAGDSSEVDSARHRLRASTRPDRGVWAITIVYLAVTGWVSWEANLWRDEMYSLYTTSQSPAFAVRHALGFELQPPLYFGALSLWRMVDPGPFWARLFSAFCGCFAILTMAAIARRLVPRIDPAFGAGLLASHPFLVWAGTEIRVYAMTVLLSSLLMLAFLRAYWEKERRVLGRLAYVALALVCVYTQYYLVVLFVGFGAALLVRRERRPFVDYAIDMLAVAVFSAPLFWAARAALGSHRDDFGPRLSFGVDALHVVFTRFETYFFSFNKAIDESRWSLSTVRAARWSYRAIVLSVVVLVMYRARRRFDMTRFSGPWPLGAMVASYAACMLGLLLWAGPNGVAERHTAGLLTPALVVLAGVPALVLGTAASQVWISFLIASNLVATTLTQLLPMAKNCDCRRIAETIASLEQADEPILVFPAEDAMPLAVYYGGQNRLLPLPRPASLERWDTGQFVLRDEHEVAAVLDQASPHARRFWLHTGTYGDSWGRDKLEHFLSRNYREDQHREFAHGVLLRHFVRKAGDSL